MRPESCTCAGAWPRRVAAGLAALFLFARAAPAATNGPAEKGFLLVERDGVAAPIRNRDYVFKVGDAAALFQLHDDELIVYCEIGDVRDRLYVVPWNAGGAPAWISNEKAVMFGKVTATVAGRLLLDKGERLPVVDSNKMIWHALVRRFGRTADLWIPRKTDGLKWVATAYVAPAAGGAGTQPKPETQIIINGDGGSIEVVTNSDAAAAVAPAAVPPASAETETTTQEPPAATEQESAAPVIPSSSLLRDPVNLAVLGGAVVLIFLLLAARKRRKMNPALAARKPPPVPAAAAAPLKLKGGRDEKQGKAAEGDTPAGRLKFTPSNARHTVILNQRAGGGPPTAPASRPQSAGDTAIIPSPSVLPERRAGGVLWIGKYAVEQLLGRGRMGVVYKAHQQDLNRTVALKLLAEGSHASSKQKERFVQEAQAIAKLRHPNIVTVYEVGDWEGQPYFTMEYVDGKTLDRVLAKQRIAAGEAAALVSKIATAVEYAHTNGIIHRDLKPGNIIIGPTGEPVITDFGLARHVEEETRVSAADDILGTPAYMPPEQARGRTAEIDARSDVYSIGAVLYSMITGQDPFAGSSLLETLHKVVHDRPAPPNEIDPDLDADISEICMKAMSKEPKKRYQTAGEFAAALAAYAARHPSAGTAAPARPAAKKGLLSRLLGRQA